MKTFLAPCMLRHPLRRGARFRERRDMEGALTVAVFCDWRGDRNLLDNAALLTQSVNADKAVSLVLHVGDIHAGSMPCVSTGILPRIATSDEWADCHKSRGKSAGASVPAESA